MWHTQWVAARADDNDGEQKRLLSAVAKDTEVRAKGATNLAAAASVTPGLELALTFSQGFAHAPPEGFDGIMMARSLV